MASKAQPMNLGDMINSNFVIFLDAFNAILLPKTVIEAALSGTIEQFRTELAKLKQSLVAERGSSYTALLNETDAIRDKIHASFIHFVNGYMQCNDAAKESAANTIYHAAKQFGLSELRNTKRTAQTALVDRLLEAVSPTSYPAEFAALTELTGSLTALKAANDAYRQLEADQVNHNSEKLKYTTQEVRSTIIPKFRAIVSFCEIMANEGVDPEYGQLIDELNALIDQKK